MTLIKKEPSSTQGSIILGLGRSGDFQMSAALALLSREAVSKIRTDDNQVKRQQILLAGVQFQKPCGHGKAKDQEGISYTSKRV